MARLRSAALGLAALLLMAGTAFAQDASVTDKLRDMLRQTIEQLRAAQDAQATLQAQLTSMTKDRDALQAEVQALQAKTATASAVSPKQQAAMRAAATEAAQAKAALAQSQAGLAKWQTAYNQAAAIARARDEAAKQASAKLTVASKQLAICRQENTKLIKIADDILHLYQTPQWNRLLFWNHEHLIGLARVKLENEVQAYEDRLEAQKYVVPLKPFSPPEQ